MASFRLRQVKRSALGRFGSLTKRFLWYVCPPSRVRNGREMEDRGDDTMSGLSPGLQPGMAERERTELGAEARSGWSAREALRGRQQTSQVEDGCWNRQ